MSLSPGTRVGPYEILAAIGAGGMGEVYRARDTKLKRDVALKLLPEAFARDPDRMARFQREAELLASLNHPNIAQIYGVEDRALIMELVEGETLPAGIPIETALRYARQIAEALEYAHDHAVVHRDLKPSNIKVTPEGTVKLLDFGLAKAIEDPAASSADPSLSPTLTLGATRLGMILGTAAYMSPEQAGGKVADRRADIWSFGAVLYEMLSGKQAFSGESASDTLASVLKLEPDWSALPKRTPPSIAKLLRRCLTKDRKQRLQAIGEARIALEAGEEPAATAPSRSRLGWVWPAVAAVCALALGVLSFVHFREQAPVPEVTRFQIPLPAGESSLGPFQLQEVSPDGRKLAFLTVGADGKAHLWVRALNSLQARLLPGVEPASDYNGLFWSPDSRFLAFLSSDSKLKKVDVSGGPAQTLCDAVGPLLGGSWSREGVILFATVSSNGIMRVPEAGGMATAVTASDPARKDTLHVVPKFLPDGRHFLYFRGSATPENSGLYVGAIDAKPAQQSKRLLLATSVFPAYYVPSRNANEGHLLFFREGTILAQRFDARKLELSREPVPVAEQVNTFQGLLGFFSASNTGVLVYAAGNATGKAQLTWFDRQGKNLGTVGEPGAFFDVALSRDGKQAAVSHADAQKTNLWLLDLTKGGAASRFTFDASADQHPVWSPDGSRIIFDSLRDGVPNLYQKLTSGAKEETPLLKSAEPKFPYDWSLDGRFLLYSVHTPKNKDDVWILPMDGSQKPMLFQGTEFNETAAKFSPDGHWIAYQSDESGQNEVYVREFLLGADGKPEPTAKHQISSGGGTGGGWRDDGKELVYLSADGKGMSVEIATKPIFQASPPKVLFPGPAGALTGTATADLKRFLIAVPVGQTGPPQFTVVQNWPAELKN